VTDNSGNASSCNATVTVQDNIDPEVVCQDIEVLLNANGTASIPTSAIVINMTDNCTPSLGTTTMLNFDCSDAGTSQSVTHTITDEAGNTASCTQTVNILDETAPDAVCKDITVSLRDSWFTLISPYDIGGGSMDVCSNISLSLNKWWFTCSNLGDNEITLTVRDDNGNSSSCTATVTVIDEIAPRVYCRDVTVELDNNGQASVPAGWVFAEGNDNCGGIVDYKLSKTEFDCDDPAENLVTLTAWDAEGNSATCTAIITLDGAGNCYADADGDGILDDEDNCPDSYNPDQADDDNDGVGNDCDRCWGEDDNRDDNNNGIADCTEDCGGLSQGGYLDSDQDGRGNACDNCPNTYNPDQEDANNNGIGDACEQTETEGGSQGGTQGGSQGGSGGEFNTPQSGFGLEADQARLEAYPNPFRDKIILSFTLPEKEITAIDVFNLQGQRVKVLMLDFEAIGQHRILWDGSDQTGQVLPSGIYLVRMRAGQELINKKVILQRD